MNGPEDHLYEFAAFRLDAAERLLMRDGRSVPLTPKVFDTLLALVRRGGRLVEKDELMCEVWPDSFVEEINLTVNISTLRKVLGEGNGSNYIETVPKRGYRFIAPVRELVPEETDLFLVKRTQASISIKEEELEEETARHGNRTMFSRINSRFSAHRVAASVLVAVLGIAGLVGAYFALRTSAIPRSISS